MSESRTPIETEEERKEREHQEDLQRLRGLRPMDDDFMRGMLRNNTPLAEFMVRIFLKKPDFKFITFETQADLKRVTGARSVIFDGLGEEEDTGRKIDLEVQRADKGAEPHRARYHSSILDVENLDQGHDFAELPDTCIIFITEKDFFGEGDPFYSIERINTTTGKPFDDGNSILYINGEYRGDDKIGQLMHDFNCTEAKDMYFPEMAERTRYLKENPKGVSEMCKVMEDMRNDSKIEGVILAYRNLNMSDEQIASKLMELFGITKEKADGYLNRKTA